MTDFVEDIAGEHEQESLMILVVEIVLIFACNSADCCIRQMLKPGQLKLREI